MIRKLNSDEDKALLRKFRSTYKLKLSSVDSFNTYKKARVFITKTFDAPNERKIRSIIFTESDKVIAAIESAFDNPGTRNTFISAYKKMYDNKRGDSSDNPYVASLAEIRTVIKNTQHTNTAAKNIRDELVGDEFDNFTAALWANLDKLIEQLNTWIKKTYDLDGLDEFVDKYSRSFNNDAKLNTDVDIQKPGVQKYVNMARSVLAVSLQAGINHVIRAEHRTLRFYRYGGLKAQNFYSKRDKKIFLNDYKTVSKHGMKIYAIRDLDAKLLAFIRVFNTSNFVFATTSGKPVHAKSFVRYYNRVRPGLTPTHLRKILIDLAQKSFPDTGNSEQVRQTYYTIPDDPLASYPPP